MSEFVVRCINCAEGYRWAVCSWLDTAFNNVSHKWKRPREDQQVLTWTRVSWSTRNALQAQLNAFHINYSSYKSEEWESLRSSACWDKKKWIFAHKLTETQMAFVAKNIFIIKAGYNKEFTDSMIDYKQW